MRRYSILNVTPSSATPGSFTIGPEQGNVGGDWTPVFRGRFYRDAAGNTSPAYVGPLPGYRLIEATTFRVAENDRYAGTYTVYTPVDALGTQSSVFAGGLTEVFVNQPVPAPLAPTDATTGVITSVSTYYLIVEGGAPIVVPPGVSLEELTATLVGRKTDGWGEDFAQNFVRLLQTSAGAAPTQPLLGQQWYNGTTVNVWNGTAWVTSSGSNKYRHTQSVATSTWTVNHNLALSAPFVASVNVFTDTGPGFEVAFPASVVFNSANTLTMTFAEPVTGIADIRP